MVEYDKEVIGLIAGQGHAVIRPRKEKKWLFNCWRVLSFWRRRGQLDGVCTRVPLLDSVTVLAQAPLRRREGRGPARKPRVRKSGDFGDLEKIH
jgi:hypothetical protein